MRMILIASSFLFSNSYTRGPAPYTRRVQASMSPQNRGKFLRISLKPQAEFSEAEQSTKLAYLQNQYYKRENELLSFYEDSDIDKDRISNFNIKVIQNSEVIRRQTNLFVEVKPKKSYEYFTGALCIYAIPFRNTDFSSPTHKPPRLLYPPIIVNEGAKKTSSDCFPLELATQWVPVGVDLEKAAYILFGILKIFFNLLMIFLTFVKPFLSEKAKLQSTWMGQTVIYWHFLMYTGYNSGLFGGVINSIQDGIIQTSTKYFFLDLQPKFDQEFLQRIFAFIISKFYDNNIYPAITEETFFQVSFLLLLSVVKLFFRIFKAPSKWIKIVEEIKSSALLFSFVPVLLYGSYCVFIFGILNTFYSFWSVVNMGLLLYIGFEFTYCVIKGKLAADAVNYLRNRGFFENQETLENGTEWSFDSYISNKRNTLITSTEYMIYIALISTTLMTYENPTWCVLLTLALWVWLAVREILKIKAFKHDSKLKRSTLEIIKTGLVIRCLFIVHLLILSFFVLFPFMGLGLAKILTKAYITTISVTAGALVFQIFQRAKIIYYLQIPELKKNETKNTINNNSLNQPLIQDQNTPEKVQKTRILKLRTNATKDFFQSNQESKAVETVNSENPNGLNFTETDTHIPIETNNQYDISDSSSRTSQNHLGRLTKKLRSVVNSELEIHQTQSQTNLD